MSGTTYSILDGNDTPHILTKCPNCDTSLFVTTNSMCGAIEELIPKDRIKVINVILK